MTGIAPPVQAADDSATARRAPPIFDVMKGPGTARSRATIPTITPPDIPRPEHVRPPDDSPPGGKPWPPTLRERMGFRDKTEPLVPKRKPCIPGMPDCR
ncbi:hypothetical protein [Caenispirillum salinarum]|uniref:hypothetical protein n=1 Tax=Caenispirillum salinarum TaxID=859058 RepID=UPI0012670F3B|nr:hypothetical protein [Caenispirillum salinarum]